MTIVALQHFNLTTRGNKARVLNSFLYLLGGEFSRRGSRGGSWSEGFGGRGLNNRLNRCSNIYKTMKHIPYFVPIDLLVLKCQRKLRTLARNELLGNALRETHDLGEVMNHDLWCRRSYLFSRHISIHRRRTRSACKHALPVFL